MKASQDKPFTLSLREFIEHERKQMEASGPWQAEIDALEEHMELAAGVLAHYGLHYEYDEGPWSDHNLEYIQTESSFEVPLRSASGRRSTIFLAGRYDGIVQRKDNKEFWIFESKTTRSIGELERSLANDFQCGMYIWAARELYDLPIKGVIYNMMTKKAPTQPQVRTNGLLQRDQKLQTSPVAYMQAIRQLHPDFQPRHVEEFYGEYLQWLSSEPNRFFKRAAVIRTPYEIDHLADDVYAIALEMVNKRTRMYPSPSWINCNFCMFRDPCLATNKGMNDNVQLMLSETFRRKVAAESLRETEQYYDISPGATTNA